MAASLITITLAMSVYGAVELRGAGQRSVEDPVVEVSPAGVTVESEDGGRRIIGWDAVKQVRGTFAQQASDYARLSDMAWRARYRLARGDAPLAEPLFDELFTRLAGYDGPTPLMAAEGLLRCRLQRGAHAAAVTPWLEALRLHRAGHTHPADIGAGALSAIERDSGLAASLPPIWLELPWVRGFAESDEPMRIGAAGDDEVVQALASLYRHAAAWETGSTDPVPSIPDAAAQHPGAQLVHQIVLARAGDSAQRREARAALEAGLRGDLGSWREAWRRVGIGRSLLREQGEAERRAGLLHLLHLPARFGDTQPYLTGVALAEAVQALEASGENAGAERLRDELRSLDPEHPALRWLDTRRHGAAASDSTNIAAPHIGAAIRVTARARTEPEQ
ncbi:MAG: hypothetical protein EA376_12035 [Phycisphaeraceae bacterium]|nr:MAG: hypothetical protein EA376_12035 [Phycisphaeraceae bacterium]